MATPLHKNPCHGGHEIYNFGRALLITIGLLCMDHAPEKRLRFLFSNASILHFLPQITSPWGGGGEKNDSFICPFHFFSKSVDMVPNFIYAH